MALTRKMLKAMGIEDEKIDEIISMHSETVDALKKERDGYKEDADRYSDAKKRIEELEANPGEDFQQKYEDEHKAFEDFKSKVESERAESEKRSLYRDVLVEAGIDQKRIASVMKVADLSGITVKDGKIEDKDSVVEGVKTEWADFVVQRGTRNDPPADPPAGEPGDPEPTNLAEAMRWNMKHNK